MATSFFLWPSSQNKPEEAGGGGAASGYPAGATVAKAKIRKGGGGAKTAGPKRPPQRGLGVAQLEQIRLQELGTPPHDLQPFSFQQLSPVAAGPSAIYGAPVSYTVGLPMHGYLHRLRPMSVTSFGGASAGSAARPVLADPFALDGHRRTAAEDRFRVGGPFPEPPSNQITQCLSDQCEFCARKKRLFGNNQSPNLSNGGADYFEMNLAAAMSVNLEYGCHQTKLKPSEKKEREAIKEFDFFPSSSSLRASIDGASSMFADRTAPGDASSSLFFATATPLDLSLKLSLFFLSSDASSNPSAGSHRRIAIAVDLSDESAYAVKWAVQNYLRPGDIVILLHVRSTSVLYGADWGAVDLSVPEETGSEESQRKLEDDFDAFTTTKAQDLAQPLVEAQIPFKIHIVKDHDMKERLCLEVERLNLSAVIMGSRGFGASRKTSKGRLGSVSDYCVHHCVCPVVVVRYPEEGGATDGLSPIAPGESTEKDDELHPVPEEDEYHDATV
ncbi:hypothetical protein ZIOFF_067101 [Zingiber officinale]|uniref:UspA domain-containing protein n=2 Tax=Zingiber officinale TaxID=94328 RepID=A0A8J5CF13_ZINOF|nr:hypothetical protein ZIOFF_067101 [Zingiber officinale]